MVDALMAQKIRERTMFGERRMENYMGVCHNCALNAEDT